MNVIENGGVRMVAEYHSLEPGMYWGVGGGALNQQAAGAKHTAKQMEKPVCLCGGVGVGVSVMGSHPIPIKRQRP